jgi:hypothetical protein
LILLKLVLLRMAVRLDQFLRFQSMPRVKQGNWSADQCSLLNLHPMRFQPLFLVQRFLVPSINRWENCLLNLIPGINDAIPSHCR